MDAEHNYLMAARNWPTAEKTKALEREMRRLFALWRLDHPDYIEEPKP